VDGPGVDIEDPGWIAAVDEPQLLAIDERHPDLLVTLRP
jgi:hypothetical protein